MLNYLSPLSTILLVFLSLPIQASDPQTIKPFTRIVSPTFDNIGKSVFKETMDVRAFIQDKQGFIWLGAAQGLLKYDGYQFKVIKYAQNDENYEIQDMSYDENNNIWITTEWNGVFKLNIETGEQQHFIHESNNVDSISSNVTHSVHISDEGIWVSTVKGLNLINISNNKVTTFLVDSKHEDVLGIAEDQQHNILIASKNGIIIKEKNSPNFESFDVATSNGKSLTNKKIRDVYIAKDNSIWVSTVSSGIWRLSIKNNTLEQLETKKYKNTVNAEAMIQVNDSIWFWTTNQGILSYDIKSGALKKNIQPDPSVETSLSTKLPLSIFEDQSGLIWLGGHFKGVQLHNPNNHAFRTATISSVDQKKITIEKPRAILELRNSELLVSDQKSQRINKIDKNIGLVESFDLTTNYEGIKRKLTAFTFIQNEHENIWVGTYPAFMVQYNLINHKAKFYRTPLKKQKHGAILSVLEDPFDGQLWLGMSEGMLRFDPVSKIYSQIDYDFQGALYFLYYDEKQNLWTGNKNGLFLLENGKQQWRHFNKTNTPSLLDHAISSVLHDKNGNTWIGTTSDIFLLEEITETSALFSSVKQKLGISIKDSENLFEDKNGRIWSSINFLFDPKTWEYREITDKDTKDLNHYTQIFTKLRSGTVVMGGATSLTFVEPEKISDWAYQPPTVINQVLVDSKPTKLTSNTLIVSSSVKRFTFDFASIDFSEPENLTYRYRLAGYDEQWNYTNASNRHVSYTALPPGKYNFEVTGKNRSGIWSPKSASVKVVINPSFYQTWWFKLAVFIFILIIIFFTIRWRISIILKKERDALEKQEAINHSAMMADLMKKKNQILADVSHELGTPLTVLKLQVEALKDNIEEDVNATYDSLDNKLTEIGHLIGDIHQLAQADTGVLKLYKQDFDINEALQLWQSDFMHSIEKNGLSFTMINHLSNERLMHVDKEKIKQVLSNLLANSIKYTDTPGEVKLTVDTTKEQLILIIEDSAPGVVEKDLTNIFERLYRVESSRNRETGGSGLGLAICKSLIEAHEGKIHAEPSSLGGLKVIIELPLN